MDCWLGQICLDTGPQQTSGAPCLHDSDKTYHPWHAIIGPVQFEHNCLIIVGEPWTTPPGSPINLTLGLLF